MSDNIIHISPAKLREARADADATNRMHEVLCLAAEETATKILSAEGREILASAVIRAALGIGAGWEVRFASSATADAAAPV